MNIKGRGRAWTLHIEHQIGASGWLSFMYLLVGRLTAPSGDQTTQFAAWNRNEKVGEARDLRKNLSYYSGILVQELWMTIKHLITACRREEI